MTKEVSDYLRTLDELNVTYFNALYDQKINPRQSEKLRIDDGSPREDGELPAYPTAIAPQELMEKLPFVHYEDLLKRREHYCRLAQNSCLWLKKTQAGGGTSILRTRYLSQKLKVPENKVKLGSKGTDLFVSLPQGMVPLAEVQIFQSLSDLQEKKYHKVFFRDIVSSESEEVIKSLWKKNKPTKDFVHTGETFQSLLPTLDETGQLTLKRLAPGGHAFFAVEALLNAYKNEKRPQETAHPLVSVIGNGEDLGSSPDPIMVGWVLEQKAPIVMITTEKTEIDLKGGQIALVLGEHGEIFVTLIEQAQAKTAGQLPLFESLGLDVKNPGQIAFFNTNVALFNYEVLVPKIKSLVEKVGEKEFLKIITPTLIENRKIQDGHTFEQLEGAMGSSLLNLDRYWREHFNEPLVHFINVGKANRTQFFSPVKSAFDFFMLFHSDRFELQTPSMRLENLNPGHLPSVSLDDPQDKTFYSEVQNVLDCFEKAKIKDLTCLHIKGRVSLRGMTLKGDITIESQYSGLFDLSAQVSILENKTVAISRKGEVKIENKSS